MTESTLAYNSSQGKLPWMSLGKEVPGNMTVEQALQVGGCNFVAVKSPVESNLLLAGDDGIPKLRRVIDPKHFCVVRTDTLKVLGVVGRKYNIIQMKEAFSFFDEALGKGAAAIQAVGTMNGGSTGFLVAQLPESVSIVEGDPIERYLLFTNSFDGSTPITCTFMANRLACTNQLSAAMKGCSNRVKIRHTKNASLRIQQASKVLNANEAYWKRMKTTLALMKDFDVNTKIVNDFVEKLYPGKEQSDGTVEAGTRTVNRREAFIKAFETSPGHELAGNTAYGLYNGLTWLIDHETSIRKGTDRFEMSFSGSGEKARQRGFNILNNMVMAG